MTEVEKQSSDPKKKRLAPPQREVSDFFFEQRLYDFANKNLEEHVNNDMKKHMDENPESKEKVGAMLLAFEYFNSISEIKIDYDEKEFLNARRSFASRLRKKVRVISFLMLFLLMILVFLFSLEDVIVYFTNYVEFLKTYFGVSK